jgi:hypothetical protein
MKVFHARVLLLAFLLLLIPLGPAERAAAEVPAIARLQDSRPLGPSPVPRQREQRSRKPFWHHGGAKSLARAKEEAATFAPTLPRSPRALVSSTVVAGFDGIDEISTIGEPPDGAIAVSPTYLIEAVNDAVSVWTKTYDSSGQLSAVTEVIAAGDLNLFLGTNPGCYTLANDFFGVVSDPSLDYDAANDRFMLSMIGFDQLFFTSSLCIAVTETGDPTGNWFIYAFPVSPFFSLLDFPRAVIGSDGHTYLSGNLVLCCDALGEPVFDHARIYAFKTSDMYVGSDTTPRLAVVGNDPETGLPADSLTPARAVGVSGMYFVSASNPSPSLTGSTITLWKWSDPFGSNTLTRQGHVTVSAYAQPPNALQPGALPAGVTDCADPDAHCITTNDARNLAAYWFGGTVWATHAVGCTQGGTPVACVQWYQLGSLDGVPALLQQGIVDDPDPGHYRFFPSLAVDGNGNVALAYAYSSASDYAGIRYTTISAGAQGPETVLKGGEATLLEPRYGDYAGTALDPYDNLTIWHVEEYAKDFFGLITEWGTWISAIQITGTTTTGDFSVAATLAPSSSPAVLPGGSDSYTVTVSALTGFTGTVSLAVSGLPAGAGSSFSPGSVTFAAGGATSGTSTLTVTTSAATPGGTYTLTITGTAAGVSHTATVTLVVQDFSIAVTLAPSSLPAVLPGKSEIYTVTVGALSGFTGTVSLAVSGLAAGASGSFSPGSVTFTTGGATSATSTLTVKTSTTTPGGTYTLTITGTGKGIVHTATVPLAVQGFSISVSPPSQTVSRPGSASYTVTVNAIGGFSAPVTFKSLSGVPRGVSYSPKPLPASISPGASFTLTLNASSTARTGAYVLTITARGAGLTRRASFQLTVQ